VHERVVAAVSAAAAAIGLAPQGMTPSPITGATGNQEYLLHLRAGAGRDGLADSAEAPT
jgi:predicted rRNA methylase YqxC with S4 and FtsJ domains